ncbi:cupin domain-containing protein [Dyella tabacisoli]|nr:cupin domain-containing protein [Dyella tabacisoli]
MSRMSILTFALLGFFSLAAQGAQEHPVLKATLTQAPGHQLTALSVSYAPGQSTPSHHHDADAFVYVLSGHIRSQLAGSPVKVYGAGESWFEPAGIEHVVSGNASTSEPATMLVVFIAKPVP